MNKLWAEAPCVGTEKLMLIALANFAKDDGICWPGLIRLSHMCCINKRHASRIIGRLEQQGYIQVERCPGRSSTNIYLVVSDPERWIPDVREQLARRAISTARMRQSRIDALLAAGQTKLSDPKDAAAALEHDPVAGFFASDRGDNSGATWDDGSDF